MAKKRRKAKAYIEKAKALRENPGVLSVVKRVAPGAGAFFLTALLSAQAPKFIPVVNASERRQKIAGLGISLGAAAAIWALGNRSRFFAKYRMEMLIGVGVSAAMQIFRLLIPAKSLGIQTPPIHQHAPKPTADLYDEPSSSWFNPKGAITGADQIAAVGDNDDEDEDFDTDFHEGVFAPTQDNWKF